MKWFKKMSGFVDERIENIQNRIYKEIYTVVAVICFVSLVVKSYIYGLEVSSYITEAAVLIISGFYYWIRAARLGLYKDIVEMHDRSSKMPMSLKNIIVGLVSGVAISLYFGIRSSVLFGNESTRLWYFILVFFTCFMIYCPFFVAVIVLSDAASKKVAKKTYEEEQE